MLSTCCHFVGPKANRDRAVLYRETVVSTLLKQEDTDGALNHITDTLTGFGDFIKAISRF